MAKDLKNMLFEGLKNAFEEQLSSKKLQLKTSDFILEKVKHVVDEINPPPWLKYISDIKYFLLIVFTIFSVTALILNFSKGPDDEQTKKMLNTNIIINSYFSSVIFVFMILSLVAALSSGFDILKLVL